MRAELEARSDAMDTSLWSTPTQHKRELPKGEAAEEYAASARRSGEEVTMQQPATDRTRWRRPVAGPSYHAQAGMTIREFLGAFIAWTK